MSLIPTFFPLRPAHWLDYIIHDTLQSFPLKQKCPPFFFKLALTLSRVMSSPNSDGATLPLYPKKENPRGGGSDVSDSVGSALPYPGTVLGCAMLLEVTSYR